MAIAHGTSTRFPATDTSGFSTTSGETISGNIAAGTDVKGVVAVVFNDATANPVSTISYGGQTMTLVDSTTDTTEAGFVGIYELLGDVITGTQSFSMTRTATTSQVWITVTTMNAATGTIIERENTNKVGTTVSTNPTVTLTTATTTFIVGGVHGGAAAPTSYVAGTDETVQFSADYGTRSARSSRSTTTHASGSPVYNFTYAASDDWCIIAAAYKETTPTWAATQEAYRFYEDGTEAGSTALGTQSTALSRDVTSNSNILLRVRLKETSGAAGAATDDYKLQYAVNGGAWTDTGTGAVTNFASSNLTDGGATTERLTGGTGLVFMAGEISEDGIVDDLNLGTFDRTELLYSLTLVSASLANNDSITFRVLRNGATTGMTYSATPTITATKASFALTQAVYGIYAGEGTETGAALYSPLTNQGPRIDLLYSSTANVGIRLRLQETGGVSGAATDDYKLQYKVNAGSWTDVGSGAVTNYSSANLTDGGSITAARLGTGTGSFVNGLVSEDGAADNLQITASNYTELLYSVTLNGASLSDSDVVTFQVLKNNATTDMTYTQTPTIYISKTSDWCVNGGFETNFNGWQGSAAGWDTATVSTSVTQFRTGAQSLRVAFPTSSAGTAGGLYGVVMKPNTTYTLNGWVYVPTGTPDIYPLAYGQGALGATVTTKDAWVQSSVTYTNGGSEAKIFLGWRNSGAYDNTDVFYIDDVTIIEHKVVAGTDSTVVTGSEGTTTVDNATENESFESGNDGDTVGTTFGIFDGGTNGTASTWELDNVHAATGSLSGKMYVPGSDTGYRDITVSASNETLTHFRTYIWIDTYDVAGANYNMIIARTTGGAVAGRLAFNQTQGFIMQNNTTTVGKGALSTEIDWDDSSLWGQWVRIEWKMDRANSMQYLRLFWGSNLHGTTPDYTDEGAFDFAAGVSVIRMGVSAGMTNALTQWWDNVGWRNADWVGPAATGSGSTVNVYLDRSDSTQISSTDSGVVDAHPVLKQSAKGTSGTSTTSVSATFASTPTSGNLLWAIVGVDKAAGTFTGPADFTPIISDSSTSVSMYMGYKVSAGTETTLTVDWTTSSPAGSNLWIGEYTSSETGDWQIISSAIHDTDETTANSWSSGTTATLTDAGEAIAAFVIDSCDNAQTGQAFTNGFNQIGYFTSNSVKSDVAVARKDVASGGTAETTWSYTLGVVDQISGAIAVFNKNGGGVTEKTGTDSTEITSSETSSLFKDISVTDSTEISSSESSTFIKYISTTDATEISSSETKLVAVLVSSSDGGGSAISYGQSKVQSADTTSLTLDSTPAADSVLLLAIYGWDYSSDDYDIASISGAGATWSAVQRTASATGYVTELWKGVGPTSTGPITISWTDAPADYSWGVHEISGIGSTAGATGGARVADSAAISGITAPSDGIVVWAVGADTSIAGIASQTPASAFTERFNTTSSPDTLLYTAEVTSGVAYSMSADTGTNANQTYAYAFFPSSSSPNLSSSESSTLDKQISATDATEISSTDAGTATPVEDQVNKSGTDSTEIGGGGQVFSDDFNRADAATLGANWIESTTPLRIVSNQVASNGAVGSGWWATQSTTDNNYCQINYAVGSSDSTNKLFARGNGGFTTGQTTYSGQIQTGGPFIQKIVNGTVTNLTGDLGSTATGTTIFSVNGSTLTLETWSVTDTSITTGKYVGFQIASTGTIRYDDFIGGDIGGAGALVESSSLFVIVNTWDRTQLGGGFSDDFNRPDTPSATANSLGAGWIATSSAHIDNNKAGSTAAGLRAPKWATQTNTANHWSQATIHDSTYIGVGVSVRGNAGTATTAVDCYGTVLSGSTTMIIRKAVAGTISDLASDTVPAGAEGDLLKLEANGSTLNAYKNGSLAVTVTDTTFETNKYVGLFTQASAPNLDNWSANDLVPDSIETASVYGTFSSDDPTQISSTETNEFYKEISASDSTEISSTDSGSLDLVPKSGTDSTEIGASGVQFSDNFNRANTGSLGANWSERSDGWEIVSNFARCQTTDAAVYWATPCSGSDHYGQITVVTPTANANAVVVRAADSTTKNCYGVLIHGTDPRLYKWVDGAASFLGSDPGSLTTNDILRIEVSGSSLQSFKNGSSLQQATDTSISTGNYVGLIGGAIGLEVDTWSGGDLAAPIETSQIIVSLTRADTTEITSTESTSFVRYISASDSTEISSTDSGALDQVPVSDDDTTEISSSETRTLDVYLTRADATEISSTETASNYVSVDGADTTEVTSSETRSILVTLTGEGDTWLIGGKEFSDNFDRANGAPAGWTVGSSIAIASNVLRSSTTADRFSTYTAEHSTSNQYSQVEVRTTAVPVGVVARTDGGSTSAGTGYGAIWSTTTSFDCVRWTAGSLTTIGSNTVPALAIGDVARIEISGSNIEIFRNGVSVNSYTDTTYNWGLKAGVFTSNTGIDLDNWSSGDLHGPVGEVSQILVVLTSSDTTEISSSETASNYATIDSSDSTEISSSEITSFIRYIDASDSTEISSTDTGSLDLTFKTGTDSTEIGGGGVTFSDNFNRADTGTTEGIGSDWNLTLGSTNYRISSNRVSQASSANMPAFYVASICQTSDNYAQVEFYTLGVGSGVICRANNSLPSTTAYHGAYVTTDQWQIAKIVNGTRTLLGSPGTVTQVASGVGKISASGSTITFDYNGTQAQQITDTSITTGLYTGLWTTNVSSFDNFSGGDLGGGSPIETSQVYVSLAQNDSTEISSTESTSFVRYIDATDSTQITSSETTSFATVDRSTTDSTEISSSETSLLYVTIIRTDTTEISSTEAASNYADAAGADTTQITSTETPDIYVFLSRTDSTELSSTDSGAFDYIPISGSDSTLIGAGGAQFSDDFNRIDSASLGSNWIQTASGWAIVSNAAKSPNANDLFAWWNTQCDSDDNWTQATWTQGSTGHVACRGTGETDGTDDSYMIRVVTAANAWRLFKRVNGTGTQLGSDYTTDAPSAGDISYIEANGSTITTKVNGVIAHSLTDTSITSGRYVGIFSTNTSTIYDDWSGGDLGGSPIETSQVYVFITTNDTTNITSTESVSFGQIDFSSSDTTEIGSAESIDLGGTATKSGIDDTVVTSSETASVFADAVASDTTQITVTETSALYRDAIGSDSTLIGSSETSQIYASSTRDDTTQIGSSETASNYATVSASDSTEIGSTESYDLGGSATKTSSDTTEIGSSESVSFATVEFTRTDSTEITSSETAELLVSFTQADSTEISSSETSNIDLSGNIDKAASDTTEITATESGVNYVSLDRSDTTEITSAETVQFAPVEISSADTTQITSVEAILFATVAIAGTDATEISSSDTSAFASTDQTDDDATEIGSSETASLYATVTSVDSTEITDTDAGVTTYREIAASDTTQITVTESPQFDTIVLSASDSTEIGSTDTGYNWLEKTSDDSTEIASSETSSVYLSGQVAISGSDSTEITSSESYSIGYYVFGSDSTEIVSTEDNSTDRWITSTDTTEIGAVEAASFGTIAFTSADTTQISSSDTSVRIIQVIVSDSTQIGSVDSQSAYQVTVGQLRVESSTGPQPLGVTTTTHSNHKIEAEGSTSKGISAW